MGPGMNSCAEFAKQFRELPTFVETMYFAWAQGYMSQWNVMQQVLQRPQHVLNGWQIGDQQQLLRKICSDKPLLDFVFAVHELYRSLPTYQSQQK